METDKDELSVKTVQLLQERTPVQNTAMDEPVRRTSRRIKEKQNQQKMQILSPKCLTFSSEVKNTRRGLKRRVSESKEKKQVKKKQPDHHDSLPGYREGLSKYELERLENIRQNQAFLHSLKLPQISDARKAKLKPTQKGLKREKTETEVLPVRKSLRLQNKSSLNTAPLEMNSSIDQEPEKKVIKKPPGPIPLDPINIDEDFKLPDDLIRVWNEVPLKKDRETTDLKSYEKILQTLSIDESSVVKVVKDRVCAAAFHPSHNLLMAAGDKSGHLGLWKPDAKWGDDGVLCFEPHSRAITNMAFSSHPCNLITISYDGFARSMDLEKAVFDEVFHSTAGLKAFDFLSTDCSTLLFGEWNGDIAVVDRRTGKSHESLYALPSHPLRGVHVHPVQQHYFLVAASSFVKIYDLRHLKRSDSSEVCELIGHSRSVSSGFFSPLTGNRVLTTCMDDRIRVFDTSKIDGEILALKSIACNMQTGRWLSKLSAVWDPKHPECFVIGSMDRPRRIQVFHESGRLLHSFRDEEHLTTVCSITAFHPSRNELLGGNASGRLHIFSDRSIN